MMQTAGRLLTAGIHSCSSGHGCCVPWVMDAILQILVSLRVVLCPYTRQLLPKAFEQPAETSGYCLVRGPDAILQILVFAACCAVSIHQAVATEGI